MADNNLTKVFGINLQKLTEELKLSSNETVKNIKEPEEIDISSLTTDIILSSSSVETSTEFDNSSDYENEITKTDFQNAWDQFLAEKKNNANTSKDYVNTDVEWFNGAVNWAANGLVDFHDNAVAFGKTIPEFISDITSNIGNALDTVTSNIDYANGDELSNNQLVAALQMATSSITTIGSQLVSVIRQQYNDGVYETTFGLKEETSWRNFVNGTKKSNKIKVLTSTPLNSGEDSQSIYGNMILGCPPTFIAKTDPLNRNMINSFVKDSKFLSLTPGLPQYNGSRYSPEAFGSNILEQTTTFDDMVSYLTKNGVDKDVLEKDKRYYRFKTAFPKFYSYLETMLNIVWIKLGLGSDENGTSFNLFTFFNNLDTKDEGKVLEQYESAIGFFVNPVGTVVENMTNNKTSFGQEMANQTNQFADTYQKINYLTGMGTGGSRLTLGATTKKTITLASNLKGYLSELLSNTISGWNSGAGLVSKGLKAGLGAVSDLYKYTTEKDIGAELQAYTAVNGMYVMYPELWREGMFTRSMNFDFNFTSPYGDPLSIFKYVFVPFCTLLCFTLPRQADDNGYVSPFFVRADLPGMGTIDLGLISNISFTRGGGNGLFTKDGLPRCISGQFTIDDLFPYLAMNRRISFISANPSYVSFLDSLTGFHATYSEEQNTFLNEYFKKMLNRVNGQNEAGQMWNRFNAKGRALNTQFGNTTATSKLHIKPTSINWFRSVSN